MRHTRRIGDALTQLEHPNFTKKKLTPDQLAKGNLEGLIPVKIDSRTTIYCKPGTEQGAVERFWELHSENKKGDKEPSIFNDLMR